MEIKSLLALHLLVINWDRGFIFSGMGGSCR